MLKVEDVFTSYGMIKALNGVTLSAAEGEITCLLGPNGAGKSTLSKVAFIRISFHLLHKRLIGL